jgi:hypothetical protein
MARRYTHAQEFKRRELKFLRNLLGRIIRNIRGKIAGRTAFENRSWPPLGAVAGVAIETLQLNASGLRALPLPMHSTADACNE